MSESSFEWNDTRQRQLVELAKRGHTGREIADKLGTTRNSVLGRCHRTGVQLPVTAEKAARHLEALREAVRHRRPKQRLPLNHPSRKGRARGSRAYTDTQIATALAARLAGLSYRKAGAMIGACAGSLEKWSIKPELMEQAQQLYSLAKADATERAEARRQAEATRRDAILSWNEGIYRLFSERDTVLLRAWVSGSQGRDLAVKNGVSRQRIFQIVKRARSLGLKEFGPRCVRKAAR